jgi:hypothetical protein
MKTNEYESMGHLTQQTLALGLVLFTLEKKILLDLELSQIDQKTTT